MGERRRVRMMGEGENGEYKEKTGGGRGRER